MLQRFISFGRRKKLYCESDRSSKWKKVIKLLTSDRKRKKNFYLVSCFIAQSQKTIGFYSYSCCPTLSSKIHPAKVFSSLIIHKVSYSQLQCCLCCFSSIFTILVPSGTSVSCGSGVVAIRQPCGCHGTLF